MKTFALVESGSVVEIIEPLCDNEGFEISVEVRYHPDVVAKLVDITGWEPQPSQGWLIDGGQAQPPQLESTPSDEALAAGIRVRRDALLEQANLRVAPLQDALDLGVATAEESNTLMNWKAYRVALLRVDNPVYQPEFPRSITWPDAPA